MTDAIRPLIAGNWKMNGLKSSLAEFEAMLAGASEVAAKADLLVCPPATLIADFAQRARGIKTLAVRMLQHNANGISVARHLDAHPKVRKAFYPGLPAHPQHDVARRQQKGPGGMLSFDLGTIEAARRFLNHVKLCSLAESLGGVETLISLPAMMTHASMPKEMQERVGISEGLVRLSVGIEDVEDIIADLDQALLYV